MTRAELALVHSITPSPTRIPFFEALADHHSVLQSYLDTHITRNHSGRTLEADRRFLVGWFEGFMVPDATHPDGERQLLLWEAMAPVVGRQRVMAFSKGLCQAGLQPRTVTGHLGCLRRYFQYVLEYPYVPGDNPQPIVSKYGQIEQPVLEYDYPVHTVEKGEEGFVLTGDKLVEFYDFIRVGYIGHNQKKMPASRDYAMIVLAGESGLRADEIRHLDALGIHRDVFYDQSRIQTRHGKASNGSGKRLRKTIFTPFAKDTLRVYEDRVRPHFPEAKTNVALFLTESGLRINYKDMWRNLHVIVLAARKEGLEMPPKLSWHSLRKSFATNFMEKHPGRPWVLMDMLGHTSPSTLHRYVKHSRAYYDRAMDSIIEELVPSLDHMEGAL